MSQFGSQSGSQSGSQFGPIIAEPRGDVGKGASRRLRREGKIPAILYGGEKDPVALTLDHGLVLNQSESESFYASVLDLKLGNPAGHLA